MLGGGDSYINQLIDAKIESLLSDVANLKARDYIVEQGNNYVRFNKGLQICWGRSGTGGDRTQAVSFKAFVDTNYIIAAVSYGRSKPANEATCVSYKNKDNAGINVWNPDGVEYIIIGKWK